MRRFLRSEQGSATVQGLFFTLAAIMVLGISVDGANGRRVQNQMQVAADAAALAAAAKIGDQTAARALALQVAALNLGQGSQAIRAEDIVFGKWNEASGSFAATNTSPDAVMVTASRKRERSNALGTYLLRFAGVASFDIATGSMARAMPGEVDEPCSAAAIVSSGSLNAGGNNTYNGEVCIHGATGVHFGGNDWFSPLAKASATSISSIYLNHVRAGSAPPADVKTQRTLAPVIIPKLNQMWTDRWALYSQTNTTYTGTMFPSFLKDPATGAIRIVRKDKHWTIQQGDIQPYTLYIVNGGAQFAGNVDASKVGFIVNGHFGVGGGQNLHFDDIYIIGTQINLAGNVAWGSQSTACSEKRFSVYLFGTQSLQMGGWGQATSIWGVVGASPQFNPGGSMTATGVYFETNAASTSLGGNMTLNGCPNGAALTSEVEIARPPGEPKLAGALLVR